MRPSPSIIPDDADRDIYLVLDDFGQLGRAWRETDERAADRDALIRDLLDGQYRDPVRIVAFNTVEGWSRDLTEEIAVGAPVCFSVSENSETDLPASLRDSPRRDARSRRSPRDGRSGTRFPGSL
jgi:hypothetical protein